MFRTALRHRIVAACRQVSTGRCRVPYISSRSLTIRPYTATSDEAIGRTEEGFKEEDEILEVRVTPFKSSCLNSVILSGIVLNDPQLRNPKQDLTVTNMNIAVPKSTTNFNDPSFDQFSLSFFNFSAKQAAKFVRKGSHIVAQGRLSVFRNAPSILVDEFALLKEGTWPYGDEAPVMQQQGQQSYRDASQTIISPYLRPSAERVYGNYENGMAIDDIAKQRNIKKMTVLGYLADCAYYGKKMNFEWLTRQVLLGPRDSQYMEIDDVVIAIKTVFKNNQATNFAEVPVMDARNLLKLVKDGVPFKNSEAAIPGVSYTQLRVAAAMMQNGMTERDWNAFRVAEIPFRPPSIEEGRTIAAKAEAPF